MELPSPENNGWYKDAGELRQELMVNASVPDMIVELTRCCCKKGCKTNSSSCRRAKLDIFLYLRYQQKVKFLKE
jgi:hypothetical protein